jgi:hypothetical protein
MGVPPGGAPFVRSQSQPSKRTSWSPGSGEGEWGLSPPQDWLKKSIRMGAMTSGAAACVWPSTIF